VPEVTVLITGVGLAVEFELSSLEHIEATFKTNNNNKIENNLNFFIIYFFILKAKL
jgi:hypothetical protein